MRWAAASTGHADPGPLRRQHPSSHRRRRQPEDRRSTHARHRFPAPAGTQPVVAAAVLQLAQEEKLRLDDQVERHLPGLLDNGTEITVEQLLNHSSGLSNFAEAGDFGRLVNTLPAAPIRLVDRANHLGPTFDPGSEAAYSPTNRIVLGLIIEEVTGQPLADVLHEQVFRPLAMTGSPSGGRPGAKDL